MDKSSLAYFKIGVFYIYINCTKAFKKANKEHSSLIAPKRMLHKKWLFVSRLMQIVRVFDTHPVSQFDKIVFRPFFFTPLPFIKAF